MYKTGLILVKDCILYITIIHETHQYDRLFG